MNAEKTDIRSLSDDTLYEIRKQVVAMHLAGQGRTRIASHLQLSYSGVVKIIKLYERPGNVVPAPAIRGRKNGQQRLLTADQEQALKGMIASQPPTAYGLAHQLWCREAIVMLVQQQTRIALPLRTVSHYMERWGYASSQLQNPDLAKQKIQEFRSKKQQTPAAPELCWLSRKLPPTLDGQIGEIISVINGRGSLRWLCLPVTSNSTDVQLFLRGLLLDSKKNLLVLGLKKEDVTGLENMSLELAHSRLECVLEQDVLATDADAAKQPPQISSWHFGSTGI
ncbi:helix-turn-helix domain-containing protein [Undibacterium sp. Di27W]|uniref:helix-turn-helix domain-containing protein n=1 Tax=Undibacterium sp. Di27W TaxID=3413036 RepID=UPI003BF3B42A